MVDASDVRKKLIRRIHEALLKAHGGDPMSVPVIAVIRDAYEASGWDRKHREESISKLMTASLFLLAWDQQRGLGDVGNLRMLLLNNALDAMNSDTVEHLSPVEVRVDTLIANIKKFWNAPVATG